MPCWFRLSSWNHWDSCLGSIPCSVSFHPHPWALERGFSSLILNTPVLFSDEVWWSQVPNEIPISPWGVLCTHFLLLSCFSLLHEVWSTCHSQSTHRAFLLLGIWTFIFCSKTHSLSSVAQSYLDSPGWMTVTSLKSPMWLHICMGGGQSWQPFYK